MTHSRLHGVVGILKILNSLFFISYLNRNTSINNYQRKIFLKNKNYTTPQMLHGELIENSLKNRLGSPCPRDDFPKTLERIGEKKRVLLKCPSVSALLKNHIIFSGFAKSSKSKRKFHVFTIILFWP